MPSWSVLTSGWGKRTGREREGEREKEGRQREGSEIGQQGERRARRGRRGMKGQKRVSNLILGKPKRERQEYETAERQNRRRESRE